jgi:hypothetical protein
MVMHLRRWVSASHARRSHNFTALEVLVGIRARDVLKSLLGRQRVRFAPLSRVLALAGLAIAVTPLRRVNGHVEGFSALTARLRRHFKYDPSCCNADTRVSVSEHTTNWLKEDLR